MNAAFTVNNVLAFNVLWWSFWAIESWADPLGLHAYDFGSVRTRVEAEGWRATGCLALGLFALCVWALKLPFEYKKSFLRTLIVPYFAGLLWLLNDKDVFYTKGWNAHVIAFGAGAILTFVGGFVKPSERIVPHKKHAIPHSGVEPSKVHAA